MGLSGCTAISLARPAGMCMKASQARLPFSRRRSTLPDTSEHVADLPRVVRELQATIADDEAKLNALATEVTAAQARNAELQVRLEALEERLRKGEGRTPPLEPQLRPDLDGSLLVAPEGGSLWLVHHGRRHEVPRPGAFDRLFVAGREPTVSDEIVAIAEGPPFDEKDRLVRAAGELPIYLQRTGRWSVLHFIPTWEVFQVFGFDLDKVQDAMPQIVNAMVRGPDLTSAPQEG